MKKYVLIGLSLSVLCICRLSANEAPFKEGELIIQIEKQINFESFKNDLAIIGLEPVKILSKRMNIWLFKYNTQRGRSSDILYNVQQHREVMNAQLNHYIKLRQTIPNDPQFANQWDKHNTGQSNGTPDADIDAPEAWDFTTGGVTQQGDTIVIAIVDDGADLSHSDLDFWKNKHEIPNDSIDNDNNGYIDDYDGWNAYDSDGNIPSDNHGTHVSGIAAAIGNNSIGVSGVNWGAKIMPVVVAEGSLESVVVEAYGYVLEMRARYNETNGDSGAFVVVTNSSFGVNLGDPSEFPVWCAMYDSMGSEGILSCAATANANWDIDVVGDMPTACPSDWLISVTNTTGNDVRNGGAAYGLTTIDLGSPGTNVLSTFPGNNYGYLTGTSMATPNVAGAVALLFSAANSILIKSYKNDPGPMALLFKEWILSGTDSLPGLQDITVTGGRLNVYNSVLLVKAYADSLDPAEPTDFTAYSDYTTPTSMHLSWTDPTNYFGGDTLLSSEFYILIKRDGILVDSVPGGAEFYQDTDLIDGQEYDYTIFAKIIVTDSISIEVSASWYAGGSPFPAPPENLVLTSDTTYGVLDWEDPTAQSDGTPVDDLDSILVYRDGVHIGSVAAGAETYTDMPTPGFDYTYVVRAKDAETPPNLSDSSNEAFGFVGFTVAVIVLSTNSIEFDTAYVGEATTASFMVGNKGRDTLEVYDIPITDTVFSVGSTSFMVLPAANREVQVTFAPTEQGAYNGIIRVISNDPVNDTLDLAVTGYGETITGIGDRLGLPNKYEVSMNYPNPFNPMTNIRYQLPKTSDVRLDVYNILGQRVRTLVSTRVEAGYHNVKWDGRNNSGAQVASGIYIYRFQAGDFLKVQKMILMK